MVVENTLTSTKLLFLYHIDMKCIFAWYRHDMYVFLQYMDLKLIFTQYFLQKRIPLGKDTLHDQVVNIITGTASVL